MTGMPTWGPQATDSALPECGATGAQAPRGGHVEDPAEAGAPRALISKVTQVAHDAFADEIPYVKVSLLCALITSSALLDGPYGKFWPWNIRVRSSL